MARPLPPGYDLATHFTPSYEPWDQRMCLVPDGDFFAAISSGQADVVTGHIEAFTRTGIRLRSGEHLDADMVVAATGLNLLLLGGIELTVDGEPVVVPQHVAFERSRGALPLQGDRAPWRLRQHYFKDAALFRGPGGDPARPVHPAS